MSPETLLEIVQVGYERRGVEFKTGGPRTDMPLFAQVIRAVLGMANRRDGGLVIIGVSDNNGQLSITGVNPTDLPTWHYDHITAGLAPYADPYVALESELVAVGEQTVVALTVKEFDDVPVLCRRDYGATLRDGACYVRPFRKPETSEIPTFADMRELLEIATTKQIRKQLRQMADAGAIIFPAAAPPEPPSDEQFNEQAEI